MIILRLRSLYFHRCSTGLTKSHSHYYAFLQRTHKKTDASGNRVRMPTLDAALALN